MAKDNFYNLGFGSVPKVQQYSNVFKSLGDTLKKPFEESIIKTKNLMALMPNGVPIDKVPEEIRGQVTDFLSKNKKSYADAAQTLATSPMGSDKYNEAMDILNGVKAKFENLSLSLEAYQQNAKLSLETFDQLALSNDQNRKLDHSNMANGNVLQSFEIDESGNGSFLSSNGNRIKFTDYKAGFVDDGTLIGSYLQLTEAAQKEGLSGINFDPIKYEAAIKLMFKNGGIDRVINFAYDGVKTGNLLDDSQPIQFIHQYIQNKTGKKPGDEGYEQLLEEYKKDEGLIDAFGNHLLGVLRDQYHGGGMQKYNTSKGNNNRNNPPPAPSNFNAGLQIYGRGEQRDGSSSPINALLYQNQDMVTDRGTIRRWKFGDESLSYNDILNKLDTFGEIGIDKYGRTQLRVNDNINLTIPQVTGTEEGGQVVQLTPINIPKGNVITLKGQEVIDIYKSLRDEEYIK